MFVSRMRIGRVLPLSLLCALAATGMRASAQVTLEKVGDPAWKPVDIHLFSAPFGTAGDGYAEFGQTQEALLPAPNHVWVDGLGRGPGAPHAGPYTHEFSDSMAALGYEDATTFSVSEFTNGSGIWFIWMVVPTEDAPIGSSPDFASGPIIPNSIFPIHVQGVTNRGGVVVDPYDVNADVPSLNAIPQSDGSILSYNVDGHSHFPFFTADNADFLTRNAQPMGNFSYTVTMRDVNGDGWNLTAHFRVLPSQRPSLRNK